MIRQLRLLGALVLVTGVGRGVGFQPYTKAGNEQSSDLVFEDTSINLGTVLGDDGWHWTEFPVTNHGTEPIEIVKCYGDCGARAWAAQRVLQPGESSVIHAAMSKRTIGRRRVSIYVETDEPRSSHHRLRLNGYVRPIVAPRASGVFMSVAKGEGDTRTVSIYADRVDVEILAVTTTHPEMLEAWIGQRSLESVDGQFLAKFDLNVRFRGVEKAGQIKDVRIIIDTTDARAPTIELPVSIMVLPELRARFRFSPPDQEGVCVGSAIVRSRSGFEFAILGVDLPDGGPNKVIVSDWSRVPGDACTYEVRVVLRTPEPITETRRRIDLLVATDVSGEENVPGIGFLRR